jgi:hypothetical protein
MTWGRKTGGRRKGSRNKKTSVLGVKAEAMAAGAGGEQPIDYMLRIMNDPKVEPARRDAMAKAAAPYRHPTMQAIQHRMLDSSGAPIVPTINLTFSPPSAPVEPPRPKLTAAGPKEDDTVQ